LEYTVLEEVQITSLSSNVTVIAFFTNLMNKFFILIQLLHPSTCFEHYCAHPQEVKLY